MTKLAFLKALMLIKRSASKDCIICHYWYLLDEGSKFQPNIWNLRNGCHYALMMSINLSDIAILNIFSVGYRCIINGISRSETINLLQVVDLSKKLGT